MDNSGLIWGKDTSYKQTVFANYIGGKTALVAQGGGQRSIFTAGVLDAFLYSNFDPFDTFYGTSAGALNLCAYLCRQPEIGKSFLLDLTTDDRFFNLFSFIRQKHYIGLDWALDQICAPPYKLDIDMGRYVLQNRTAYAAVTRVDTFHDKYLPMLQNDWLEVIRATCAIPNLVSRPVNVAGDEFVDGGVSASIPLQEAWRCEARSIIVIRTELPESFEIEGADPSVKTQDIDVHNIDDKEAWYQNSIDSLQLFWNEQVDKGKKSVEEFIDDRLGQNRLNNEKSTLDLLNGGRWLFGADNVYRLSHLLGNRLDAGLADMLMVHYQTYALTQAFIAKPPPDCFVMQIVPDEPLRSSSLMSSVDDLLFDYQQGLNSGYRFINEYQSTLNCKVMR
ncbi:patatin family protein [Vibrio sp. UCD-FRSSP16_10]|uniref:patatin-like phospholipase family protein n=1 Tax=unclassified Vibrio TaxID=2614977 RepID=UPI0007FDFAA7|nr:MULTISPECIES: patatin-like phospholipase family protein [unclassified Vibrio]OBT08506.1 patatin family protein [Vibrio sp. UCD-FRSSP16_30]OBT18036.1 patatin family protein [Vibrio sp. UCD-FRSSP16_10]